jgi:gas vesicle protein
MAFISGIVVGVMVGACLGLVVMALMTAASDGREEE